MSKKVSYGIALCRHNEEKNNRIEILMIKKRYSYEFINFVLGRYQAYDKKTLFHMFNNMSFAEKIDIFGMQFENMWYRIWINNPVKQYNILDVYKHIDKNLNVDDYMTGSDIYKCFKQKKNKFFSNFGDNVTSLRNLIINSSNSEIMWEMPKGKLESNETCIDCAIREFYEETSVKHDNYRIFYNVDPVVETIVEDGCIYKQYYYIAECTSAFKPSVNFENFKQISEVEQVKWVSIDEIDFMSLSKGRHEQLLQTAKNVIKKFKKARSKKLNYLS